MVDEHYHLQNILEITAFFTPNEKVTCIDGTSKTVFIGTSHGRVLLLDLSTKSIIHAVQLATNAAIVQIIAATALGYLIVLSASTIFNIEIETLKPISSSTTSNIAHIALNRDPVVTDPFALQLAVATTSRLILICENKTDNLEIKQKIRTDDNVVALSYNKYCICYAVGTAYFIHNIQENKTISLFPYDPQAIHPIIVIADAEEFLVNGMQGLGVFATSEGVSSRPPLFWGSTSIVSFAYRSPYIFVLTASSVTIYSSEKSTVLQRLSFTGGTLLQCVDGQLYICSSKNICLLEEVFWFDRAKALVDREEFDEALQLAENAISNGQYDEAEILKFNELRQDVAISFFKRKEFEKFYELAISSELDPREILVAFEYLLPFPSGFQSQRNLKGDFNAESGDLLNFLERYLKTIRTLHWAAEFRRDIDAILLKLISERKDILDAAEDMSLNFHCTFEDCCTWMRNHKRQKFLISIGFCLAENSDALAVSRELYDENQWDDQITELCLQFFPNSNSEQTLLEWVEFLLQIRSDDVVDALKRCSIKIDHSKIVQLLLQHNRSTLIKYLEEIKPLQNAEFHSMLFSMYVEEINMSFGKGDKTDEAAAAAAANAYRKKLRTFILQPNMLDFSDTDAILKRYRHFAVERILLEGTQEKGSVACLEKLLNEYNDYDAAELFCIYADTSDHILQLLLLKCCIRKVRSHPELKLRIINLLNTMGFIPKGMELLQGVPMDWSLSSVLSFAERAVLAVENRTHCQQLRKTITTRALETLSAEAQKRAYVHIEIDEKTNCTACGAPIGNEDIACYPHSTQIFHRSCLKA